MKASRVISKLGCVTKPELETMRSRSSEAEISRRIDRILEDFRSRLEVSMADFQTALIRQVHESERVTRMATLLARTEAHLPRDIKQKTREATANFNAALDHLNDLKRRQADMVKMNEGLERFNRVLISRSNLFDGVLKAAGLVKKGEIIDENKMKYTKFQDTSNGITYLINIDGGTIRVSDNSLNTGHLRLEPTREIPTQLITRAAAVPVTLETVSLRPE